MKRSLKRLAVLLAAMTCAGAAAGALAQPPGDAPPADEQPQMVAASGANLRALDKITGNARDFTVQVGESWTFGRLKGTVRACYQSRPQDTPEAAAFLEIRAVTPQKAAADKPSNVSRMNKGPQPIGPDGLLFSGWMFASSPGLSALEHPTYDVWVISCSASAP